MGHCGCWDRLWALRPLQMIQKRPTEALHQLPECGAKTQSISVTWELVRKAKSQAIWEPSHSKVNSGGEAQRLFEQALQMGLGSLTLEGR